MPRLLVIAIFALAALFPAMALATAQVPDRILIGSQAYPPNTNPLTPLLDASGWRRAAARLHDELLRRALPVVVGRGAGSPCERNKDARATVLPGWPEPIPLVPARYREATT